MDMTSDTQWQHALLPPHATIRQAIENLNVSALQIVLVVTETRQLLGSITDGDIRRGLLRGLHLESPIERIMHSQPLVVPEDMQKDVAIKLMQTNKVHQLPIVDVQNHVVGLHILDEISAKAIRSNVMVIMAGGKGMRLRPYTENCPKPMLELSGKPMLEHIIERAKAEGFRHFLLAIHYLGHVIEDYFQDGSLWGVSIKYLKENQPLGTAGALSLMQEQLFDSPFVVTNGDVITDIRYGEILDFHKRHTAVATMAVRLYEWQNPFGVVHTEGLNIIGFEEKPISHTYINSGVYVLEPEVLKLLAADEYCDMPVLFEKLYSKHSKTIVYPMHEPWLDVGNEADFHKAVLLHQESIEAL